MSIKSDAIKLANEADALVSKIQQTPLANPITD